MTGKQKQAKKSSKIVPVLSVVCDEQSYDTDSMDGQLRVDTSEEEEPKPKSSSRADSSVENQEGPLNGLATAIIENMEAEDSDEEDDDNELIDKSVEQNIRAIAIKNNLDHNSVRRILRKLVRNDHVLALVKIKEEEMIKLETITGSTSNSVPSASKNIPITRLRAKELNPNLAPMKQQQISPETAMLIHQELNSDDEDDEYQPCEEDMHSDDNTTISDIDSQPRTPATPFQSLDNCGYLSPGYSKDGVFKVPKSLDGNDTRLSNEEQEIIAQRTRSKVCMQATPIEDIESTFIPPDITLDMYDFDWEIDNVYKEFLTDMQKPMQHHENDDDENDPEYVAADKEPIDREEHKMSRVSKKEVNDLLKEVWDMIGSIDFDETLLENVTNELINEDKSIDLETPEVSLKGKPSPRPKKSQSQTPALNNSNNPTPGETSGELLTYTQLENVKTSPKPETNFIPNVMSTPTRDTRDIDAVHNSICVQTDMQITSTNVVNVIQPSVTTTLTDLSSALYIPQTTTYFISDNNLYQINGVPCQNGILQMPSEPFPSILPTFQLTTSTTTETLSSDVSQYVKIENISNRSSQINTPNVPMVVIPSNLTDDIKTQQMSRAFCAMEKRYAYLNDSNYEMKFDADQIGFTDFQRQLLDQQLRQHVQILTTNFAQTYGHPSLFRYADRFLDMLKEMDEKYEEQKFTENTAWNIWNLKPAILFCNSWIKTLSVDTKSNRKYLEFLNKELQGALEYRKKRMYRPIKLAKKLTNWIIGSYAIVYPKMLPKCGYNIVGMTAKNPFVPSEDFIFAYRLENCYEQIHKDIECGQIKKPPGLLVVCNSIAASFNCRFRTGDNIFQYVKSKKSKACPMNPIKYYFEYGKWPPMKYNLEPFDQNTIKPLKDMERSEIENEPWEKIVFSKSRQGKLHNKRLIENGLPPEYIVLSDTDDSDVELLRNTKENQTPQLSTPRIKIIYKTVNGKEIQPQRINYKVQVNTREVQQCPQHNSKVLSRISCLCSSADDCSSNGDVSILNESSFDPNQRLLSEFFPKVTTNTHRKPSDYELYTKFRDVIEQFHEEYDKYKINISNNEMLLIVYNSIKTLDVYTQLLVDIKMNPNFQINLDNFTNSSEQAQSILSINPVAAGSQKPFNHINSKVLNDEREFNYAQNFYDKVRETFLIEKNSKDFEAFQSYLLNFDYEKDTVPELYYKMEKLFYPRHQALAELFITFLLPGHAAQVGKFYENFMLTNMATFITKLNTYYSRQPAQIRKIYSCLNDLTIEKDLSMEKIKQKILPLLKGNQILTDWFLQLFPLEPPLETPETEYETIHVAKHQNDDGKDDNFDDYETIPPSEIVQDNEIQGCGIKYIQGRIYYGNRVLLPAKLSFLAYDVLPLKGTTPGKNIPDNQSIKSITDSDIDKIVECVHGFGMCNSERSVRSEDIIKCSDSEPHSWQSDNAESICENLNHSKEKTPKMPKRKYSGRSVSPTLGLTNNKESPIKEYILCDKETLKQHAIRLNPILHGNKVQESENIIENSGTLSKDESSDSSIKNSPKRQKLNLLSPPRTSPLASTSSNSNGISKIAVQKRPSPNQRNSMKKSQSDELNKIAVQMPKPNSPAIKTAQKLKTLIGSDSSSDDDRPLSERLEQYRLKKMAASNKKRVEDETSNENLKRDLLPPPPPQNKIKTRRQKKIIVEIEAAPPPSPDHIPDYINNPSTSTSKVNSVSVQPELAPLVQKTSKEWTRNEDKVILEAIDGGLTEEQELFDEISTYLTDRTYEEIVERHKFLMDVLKQFQTKT